MKVGPQSDPTPLAGRRLEADNGKRLWDSHRPGHQDLESLNGSTERDFLAVGEKLMEFQFDGASDCVGHGGTWRTHFG